MSDPSFQERVESALKHPTLHDSLSNLKRITDGEIRQVYDESPEYDRWRDEARNARRDAIANLGPLLETFETAAMNNGTVVHWARTHREAAQIAIDICRASGSQRAIKTKSMLSEEIGLVEALEAAGIPCAETDIGEHVIQATGDRPSHVVAPAVHKTLDEVTDWFKSRPDLYGEGDFDADPLQMAGAARTLLRRHFLEADIGFTGGNSLLAEEGAVAVVTNEGNAEVLRSVVRTHVAIVGIEKVIRDYTAFAKVLRVLAPAATGQRITRFTSLFFGPGEDGTRPQHMHVILVDAGRSWLALQAERDALACIRCGACMNQCPVYRSIGGHAYGGTYPGPIGAALQPGLAGIEAHADLFRASTECKRCDEVCPVRIPLTRIMHQWRRKDSQRGVRRLERWSAQAYSFLARHPLAFRLITGLLRRAAGAPWARWLWPIFSSLPATARWRMVYPHPTGGAPGRRIEAPSE